jgi:hypothetical protein
VKKYLLNYLRQKQYEETMVVDSPCGDVYWLDGLWRRGWWHDL